MRSALAPLGSWPVVRWLSTPDLSLAGTQNGNGLVSALDGGSAPEVAECEDDALSASIVASIERLE